MTKKDPMVWCGACRAPLDETVDQSVLAPCPRCGSLLRLRSFEADEQAFMTVFGAYEQQLVIATPWMMGAIVGLGPRVADGRTVEAVAPLWFEIVKRLAANPHFAYELSPREWEEIVAAAYKRAEYDEVILTPRSADQGRDVIAIKRDFATVRLVNQVKRYSAGRIVTADEVRALYGVMHLDGANKAVITTTAKFAPRLREDRLLSSVIPRELDLIDRDQLIPALVSLARRNSHRS